VTLTSGAVSGSDAALGERSQHPRLLYESALAFSQTLDLDTLLPLVLLRFRALLRADGAAIWLAEDGVLRCRLSTGAEGGPDVGDESPLDALATDDSDVFALSARL
jgi:hypothetical protein